MYQEANGEVMTLSVAFADDHMGWNNLIYEVLSGSGFTVTTCAVNGSELINAIENSIYPPDVVILDIHMPVMDGIAATSEIKSRWPGTKVIILSSEIHSGYIKKLRSIGASAFLDKAFDLNILPDIIWDVYRKGKSEKGYILNAVGS